jgi:hypothetical protein
MTRHVCIALVIVSGLVALGYHFAPQRPPGDDDTPQPSIVEHFEHRPGRTLPAVMEPIEAT